MAGERVGNHDKQIPEMVQCYQAGREAEEQKEM